MRQAWVTKAKQWEGIEHELALVCAAGGGVLILLFSISSSSSQETERYNRFRISHFHVDMPGDWWFMLIRFDETINFDCDLVAALFDKMQTLDINRSTSMVQLFGQVRMVVWCCCLLNSMYVSVCERLQQGV